jgi:hypothetical protein
MNRNKNNVKKDYRSDKRKSNPKGSNKKFDYNKEKEYFQQRTNNHATDYFSDAQLAEQNSYVSSRSFIDSKQTITGTKVPYPSVIVHAYNPSVSVAPYDFSTGEAGPSPLSQAASKLLVAIMANTGRINNYTKNDIIALIAMLGQFIAMTEYGRRTFGLYNKFNMINRDIPKQFLEASGFEWDDFRDNYYTYLSRFNWLINQSSQFVIPMDKIPYFRRCRDQFKDVYKDTNNGMTMYHMNVPYSTWILDEFSSEQGSTLRTVNVTGPHEALYYVKTTDTSAVEAAMSRAEFGASHVQPHSIWTFGEFLDKVYEPLINSIFGSNTFNLIFTDLRNAKFQAQYSFEFWHADLVTTDYSADIKDPQSDIMTMYHNTTIVGAPLSDHNVTQVGSTEVIVTRFNDVQLLAGVDRVAYNPAFIDHHFFGEHAWNTDGVNAPGFSYSRSDYPIVMDFMDENPSLDLRVDCMMQKASQFNNYNNDWYQSEDLAAYVGYTNYILPLWYCVGVYAKSEYKFNLTLESDVSSSQVDNDVLNGWFVLSPTRNELYYPVVANAAISQRTTMGIMPIIYNPQTGNIEQDATHMAKFKLGRATGDPSTDIYMNYMGGVQPGVIPFYTPEEWAFRDQEVRTVNVYNASGFIGDVDSWYVLPKEKLINMFNHAYQHLFTAENIVK